MTAKEYHQAVATHDQRMIEAAIDRIPMNVNRAGKHYRKIIKEIRERYELQNYNRTQRA